MMFFRSSGQSLIKFNDNEILSKQLTINGVRNTLTSQKIEKKSQTFKSSRQSLTKLNDVEPISK